MFKKILSLLILTLTLGYVAQAQSVNVTIAGSTSGTPLTVTAVPTDVLCNGGATGTVTATKAGGNSGTTTYTIAGTPAVTNVTGLTSGIFTGLPAGAYTVTATNATGGCSATSTSVTVAEPTALTVSVTASVNPTCFGGTNGTITASTSGGSTIATTYTITGTPAVTNVTGLTSGIFTGLPAGVYTVTATKGTCTATTTPATTLTAPTQLVATVTGTLQIACGATTASATITASGGTPNYTYGWPATTTFTPANPASGASTATGLVAGTYNVTVTDANGCATTPAETAVVITAPFETLIATVQALQISCNSLTPVPGTPAVILASTTGSVAVTAVTDGTTPVASPTYTWASTGAGATMVSSQTGAAITALAPGTYTVVVSKTGYCPSEINSKTIDAAPMAVSATAGTTTNDNCQINDGAVTLTGTGGTGAKQVKWTTATVTTGLTPAGGTPPAGSYIASPATFSGLTGGYTYKFVIKDSNGCETN